MSNFKTKGLIIKIGKIKEKDFLYTIYSYDYGIIKANKKLNKSHTWWKLLDLWYIINFEIITKEYSSIHKIKNIQILSEFSYENKSFNEINNYLILLNTVAKKIPLWTENYEIFEIFEVINSEKKINETSLILANLKIISLIWELRIEHADKTVLKILNFIHLNKITKIIKLVWIDEKIKKVLAGLAGI